MYNGISIIYMMNWAYVRNIYEIKYITQTCKLDISKHYIAYKNLITSYYMLRSFLFYTRIVVESLNCLLFKRTLFRKGMLF